ncbi:MAG: hypothetical protein U0703_10925 [Anaerolineae bacterium]
MLRQGIQGISELITVPALINLDFADVRTIMSEGGGGVRWRLGIRRVTSGRVKLPNQPSAARCST